jgi:DNA-binding response OmpR family regulator
MVDMRILVIEDDRKAAELLATGLKEEGLVVDVAGTAEAGDEMASVNTYAVIVLDWLLPDREGVAVCRDLRRRGVSTPIPMLTARDALEDRVTGLDAGADDYLIKPYGFSELMARIRALLRRSDLSRPVVLRVADLELDTVSQIVARGGEPIDLTAKEYAILEILMRHAGAVVPRSALTEHVWVSELEMSPNLLEVHLSRLRRKIDHGRRSSLIQTIRGRGYLIGDEEA